MMVVVVVYLRGIFSMAVRAFLSLVEVVSRWFAPPDMDDENCDDENCDDENCDEGRDSDFDVSMFYRDYGGES